MGMEQIASWHLSRKMMTPEELLKERAKSTSPLVFTNGCFDLLHYGHLRLFEDAAQHGTLVVAVNSDASVKRLKGTERPVVPQQQRMAMVAGVEAVRYVLLMEDDTPVRLIEMLKPDVHVKGGDWKEDELVEAKSVRAYGGQIIIVKTEPGWSTTDLIRRIRAVESKGVEK